jgi:hypothetical protein
MRDSNAGWVVADWVMNTFADPELVMVLVAGVGALVGFWVTARIAELKARDPQPADDLMGSDLI